MSSRKRAQLPQERLRGVQTRTPGARRDGQAIKGQLKGSVRAAKLTNRATLEAVTVPRGSSQAQLVRQANRWREQYNPLRGLTIRRAVALVETYDRGEFSDLQWAYRWIERHDETLSPLVTLRAAAVRALDWTIKLTPDDELPPGATPEQAQRQLVTLRTAYDRIGNLRAAIAHLAIATFRGFAHLEKQDTDGDGHV
ncbi:MAG: hypothetical protein KIT22_07810, partial [Verrucomicrobiae bacterium]|nr:hypothetical protein [Verrucomicrobiae bacterium]